MKITVKEAAKMLNIGESMMYQIEEGFKQPSPKLAIKMAELFNCN